LKTYTIEEAQLIPVIENGQLKGYIGTIKYKQFFCAKNLNQISISKEIPTIQYDYCDTTYKVAQTFIKKLETSGGAVWIIRIGNISVLDTH
jgi:hypothetical protein